MKSVPRSGPSPALVLAFIALSVALAGSAVAAGGGGGGVTKAAVKKIAKKEAGKQIKKRAPGLTVAHSATADSAAGADTAANLAASEPYHAVGAPGEPAFRNGVDNDCLWFSATQATPGLNPVSFYKDKLGVVHFAGQAIVLNGPGGDAECGPAANQTEALADATAFILPPGYRPDNVEFQSALGMTDVLPVIIGADQDTTIAPMNIVIPAGAVIAAPQSVSANAINLDGQISFRAAGTAAPSTAAQAAPRKANIPASEVPDPVEQLLRGFDS
jgi:hypothetical protein